VVTLAAALTLTAAVPFTAGGGTRRTEAHPTLRTATRLHEEAVLKSSKSTVAAGDSLPLVGSEFEPGETFKLRLQGALNEYELPSVKADSSGRFTFTVRIPSEVHPGVYRVVAIAPDGDEAAAIDLTVLPGAAGVSAASAESSAASAAAADWREQAHAEAGNGRADAIPIERSRSGAEWGVIGLLVGLAGGLGISLWRRG